MSNLDSSKLISLVREHSSNLLKESRYMDAVAHYDKEFANNDHLIFIDNIFRHDTRAQLLCGSVQRNSQIGQPALAQFAQAFFNAAG